MFQFKKQILVFLILFTSGKCLSQQTRATYPGFYDEVNNIISADSSSKLYVDSIIISGNKKTKNYIILRELKIKKGDSIIAGNIRQLLVDSRMLIYNTNLFSEIEIEPSLINPSRLTLYVKLKERWFVYPNPIFTLTDRTFNEWWNDYNADLGRINYGIRFTHINVSGRADNLKLNLLNGYNRNIYLEYSNPYIGKNANEGFAVGISYTQNKEFPYKTSYNNKLLQFKKSDYSRESYSISGLYRIRRGFYKKHIFSLQYHYAKVNDSVVNSKYNPNYFSSEKSFTSYFDLSYGFQYINVNNINYPLTGKIYSVFVTKRGLGIEGKENALTVDIAFRRFHELGKSYFFSWQVFSKIRAPFNQPYINQRAMGYGGYFLRGLENYVIDGVASGMTKLTFSKKIFSFKIPVPFRFNAIPNIPLSLYAKTYSDFGYNYAKKEFNTRLNNVFLYSGGAGLDILSLYDFNMSLEYSFNQLGKKGLFLQFRTTL
jgi:outer membrane protein assembly factor BamA